MAETLLLSPTNIEVEVTTSDASITPENSFAGYLSVVRTDPKLSYGAGAHGETFEEALQRAREVINSAIRASRRLEPQYASYWLDPTDFQIRFPNDLLPKDPMQATYPDENGIGIVVTNMTTGSQTLVPNHQRELPGAVR